MATTPDNTAQPFYHQPQCTPSRPHPTNLQPAPKVRRRNPVEKLIGEVHPIVRCPHFCTKPCVALVYVLLASDVHIDLYLFVVDCGVVAGTTRNLSGGSSVYGCIQNYYNYYLSYSGYGGWSWFWLVQTHHGKKGVGDYVTDTWHSSEYSGGDGMIGISCVLE